EPSSGTSTRLYTSCLARRRVLDPCRRLRPQQQNGRRRRPQHALGHAAEHQPAEPAAAMRAHHDEVGLSELRGIGDRIDRRAIPNRRLDVGRATLMGSRGHPGQVLLGLLDGGDLGVDRVEERRSVHFHRAEQDQLGALAAKPDRRSQGPFGQHRTIERNEYDVRRHGILLGALLIATGMPDRNAKKNDDLEPWAGPGLGAPAPRVGCRGPGDAQRMLCLVTRRWKVLRSMPAALAAAEMLPSWLSSRRRRYEASSTLIHCSLASLSGSDVASSRASPPGTPPTGPPIPSTWSRRSERMIVSPSASAHARSMTFCSSRTLPGHRYVSSAATTSGAQACTRAWP